MEFEGPESGDYANVSALNCAYLHLLANVRDDAAEPGHDAADRIVFHLRKLSGSQIERLSMTPFLLFSFREREDDYWDAIFDNPGSRDLFLAPAAGFDEHSRLIAAGLAFVWQLVRRNPYAARLICGASLHWCERIAETTICQLLAMTSARSDLLILRFHNDEELWIKLLRAGVSYERQVRDAAHLSALQAVLTRSASAVDKNWALAARTMRGPGLQVRDQSDD